MPKRRHKYPFVQVSTRLKTPFAEGHPWVYADAVTRAPAGISTGEWVHVQCGNLHRYGLWDGDGPIAIRLMQGRQRPNRAWAAERVRRAWELRAPLRDEGARVSAFRWLYGESDGLPGIVVDLYGDIERGEQWAVVRSYSKSVETLKQWVVEALTAVAPLGGILERGRGESVLLQGSMPPQEIIIVERDALYEVDVQRGQKTGFFLDQRDNRQTVGKWSHGRSVLNLFAYTGGFSVTAALGGATVVTSVDSAAPAISAAERNFARNGLDAAAHEFVVADCFELLARYHGEGRRFDLIVVDPPSFARSKAQLEAALGAYRRLNALSMKCLALNGLLASSSCTSQLGPDAFRSVLAAAASDAGQRLLTLHEAGQPIDHPVPVHFPQARYLKFVLAASEPANP